MNKYEKYKSKLCEVINEIEKFEKVTPGYKLEMFLSVLELLGYLCVIGKYKSVDFKTNDVIKKIPELFERKYDIILELFPPFKIYYYQIHCYVYLNAKSGLRFLIDSFYDEIDGRSKELMQKMDDLLQIYIDFDIEIVMEIYEVMKNRNVEAAEDYKVEWYYHHIEMIMETRHIPNSHTWWPECCRKDED